MKNAFKPSGIWGAIGLALIVILVYDFLQKPAGGIGITRTLVNAGIGTFRILTGNGSTTGYLS